MWNYNQSFGTGEYFIVSSLFFCCCLYILFANFMFLIIILGATDKRAPAGLAPVAIGLGLMFGFRFKENFDHPYVALSIREFWRRWHISLSTWLRDYLYIPLGGTRKGWHRTQVNLMVTMLLGGLWHGAAWTFVIWGGLHGFYLGVERFLRERFGQAKFVETLGFRLFLGVLTYFLVNLTWVFFRARDFPQAWSMIRAMLGFGVEGTELATLTHILPDGYYVVLVARKPIARARAQFHLKQTARMLARELE